MFLSIIAEMLNFVFVEVDKKITKKLHETSEKCIFCYEINFRKEYGYPSDTSEPFDKQEYYEW